MERRLYEIDFHQQGIDNLDDLETLAEYIAGESDELHQRCLKISRLCREKRQQMAVAYLFAFYVHTCAVAVALVVVRAVNQS